MSKLALDAVSKSFGALEIIPPLDLTIEHGEFCALVGPSGCGKSTLLRIIAGLEPATSGRVLVDGEDVTGAEPPERGVAMVFQSYALYPHMNVASNIGFGLKIARRAAEEIRQKVDAAADKLRLDALLSRMPRELSGGQRQRVAIGRAITRDPRIFLLDEPLSNLDAALRGGMRVEIARLRQSLDATMIYVTHDQVEAMTLADRIVVMNKGRIEQIGAPMDLYHNPANRFVAGFIGSPSMNFFDAEVRGRANGELLLRLAGGGDIVSRRAVTSVAGGRVTLGIRPEHVEFGDGMAADNRVTGTVQVVERLGCDTLLHIDVAGNTLVMRQPRDLADIHAGEPVTCRFPAEACHVFAG
ncbi:ABC transporter ATP-binding protein [Pleomorphomonas koreensis]|uniref:ABC transporter ATP-binding protein n=1 Tax=Pleomorphomonas koreensis TaxID=257440 RepID=UPI0003FA512C|nr:ABC transporter ATP-binding protein [Pleomorphomonas koreensis]